MNEKPKDRAEAFFGKMPEIDIPVFPNRRFDITSFGAVGDGFHSNTAAIHAAVSACHQEGGGTVVIPAGLWLTGPIVLMSNVNLHLERGALVTFSRNYDDYPLHATHYEGLATYQCASPISAENAVNIAITGDGIFDGSGDAWRPVKKFKTTSRQWQALLDSGGAVEEGKESIWFPTENAREGKRRIKELLAADPLVDEDFASIRDYLRPVMVSFRRCSRILIDGPTFQNSPNWTIHPWVCEHLTIRNMAISNPWFAQNGDGIDVDSCRYVYIGNSRFDVGDDAICIKSGKDRQGRLLNKPSQYIVVDRCIVHHGHGGFVIGSEMSGGVSDIWVSDCTFIGTDVGLRFKSRRGRGGNVENIYIRNTVMKDIKGEAITFNMYYQIAEDEKSKSFAVTEETPQFQHIYMDHTLVAGAKYAMEFKGLPEMPIHDIFVHQANITADHGVSCTYARSIHLDGITVNTMDRDVYQCEDSSEITLDGKPVC